MTAGYKESAACAFFALELAIVGCWQRGGMSFGHGFLCFVDSRGKEDGASWYGMEGWPWWSVLCFDFRQLARVVSVDGSRNEVVV